MTLQKEKITHQNKMKIIAALCVLSLFTGACNERSGSAYPRNKQAGETGDAGGMDAFRETMALNRRAMTLFEVFQSLGLMQEWSDDFAKGYVVSESSWNLGEAIVSYDTAGHGWLNRMIVTVEAIPPEGVDLFDPIFPDAKVVVVEVTSKSGKYQCFRYQNGIYEVSEIE